MITLSVELDRVLAGEIPTTKVQWQEVAEGLLTPQACVFLRNLEISSLYAQLYQRHSRFFKWAGMAAFASYHARIALWPLKLKSDGGFVELERVHEKNHFKLEDIDIVRQTNNAIFKDIFWAHLAYDCSEEGLLRLRSILNGSDRDRAILRSFESIEAGRLARESSARGSEPAALVWSGNISLLEHEQREVVQWNFERMTCSFARLFSIGSALDFEARTPGEKMRYFTSFYVFMWTRGLKRIMKTRRLPLVTNFSDRWAWISTSIVPRYRRFESSPERIHSRLNMVRQGAEAAGSCAVPLGDRGLSTGA